jgi:ribonuclease HI
MNCSIIAELRQWTQWIQLNPPCSLLKPPCPKYTIITDAAPQGWGATFSQLEKPKNIRLPNQAPENLQVQPFPSKIVPSTSYLTFGKWRRSEQDMTSNRRELIAIYRALEVFQPRLEAQGVRHILIQSDNTTAVYNINRKAAAATLYLDLRHLLKRSEKLKLTMTAIHIPGVENTTTDSLSRLELSGDYQIRKAVSEETKRRSLRKAKQCYFDYLLQLEKGKKQKGTRGRSPRKKTGKCVTSQMVRDKSADPPSDTIDIQEFKKVRRRRESSCYDPICCFMSMFFYQNCKRKFYFDSF